jgi:CDP-glycerol glycerophosphotransferase
MPQISVVIPVHGVEDYLDRCLDSVLSGTDGDLEVIAVNDASPDRCAAILAARDDPRLRVLTNQTARGPGQARAQGMAAAKGEYVWFADGDDELAPGALTTVSAALKNQHPDLLLLDYENLYPDGTTSPSGASLAGPERAALADHPAWLNLTMTVWSKVFRREFAPAEFGPGIHEDVPVSALGLLTAASISPLASVCYRYRRARPGSFMTAASARHFDIFSSYERIYAERPVLTAPVERALFERAIGHYSTTFPLVPAERRREFFGRMTDDFRRWRPEGYTFPAGARGAKLRLVALGSYPAWAALAPLNRARVAVRG